MPLTVVYKIIDVSQASSTLLTIETASATAKNFYQRTGAFRTFFYPGFYKEGLPPEKAKRKVTSLPSSKLF